MRRRNLHSPVPIPGGGRRPGPTRGVRRPANGIREYLSDIEPAWATRDQIVEECVRRWGREPKVWSRGLDYLLRKGDVVRRTTPLGGEIFQTVPIDQMTPQDPAPRGEPPTLAPQRELVVSEPPHPAAGPEADTTPSHVTAPGPDDEQDVPEAPPLLPEAEEPAAGTSFGRRGLASLKRMLTRPREAVAHVEVLPARAAVYDDRPIDMPPALRTCFPPSFRFYRHQGQAIRAAEAGRHVVVATGTSSGKTTCYNVPVLKAILAKPGATALYVFPTKALAQDQLKTLRGLIERTGAPIRACTYHGDTPIAERDAIRNDRNVNVLITTPDMMNASLLAHHWSGWGWFFERLRYVVVDEVHTYRGIFGSHFANLMRRLRRVVQQHGSLPTFICCSATIANAKPFVEKLCGLPFVLVDEDGSPQGERTVIFWNPPLLPHHLEDNRRQPAFVQTIQLLSEHVRREVRTIAFVRSRKLTERVYRDARQSLAKDEPALADRIAPYRGGYLASQRREIERRLFDDELLGVVTTNALELGVDVGSLDAAIITGFPGTIASFWQQAGRAGRGGKGACITFVADEDALNQYWMANPPEFFSRSHEHAIINPENPYVLDAHVACTVKEAPPSTDELPIFGPGFKESLRRLEARGLVAFRSGRWRYVGKDSPQHAFSIRSIGNDPFQVLDSRDKPVGEPIERARVFHDMHPNAVYYHMGESYVVKDLDLERKRVHLAEEEAPYTTEPITDTDIDVLARERSRAAGDFQVHHGHVRVKQQVTGFVRLDDQRKILKEEDLELPEVVLETKALWFELTREDRDAMMNAGRDVAGSLHAAEHALIGATPLLAMCDRWDLGGVSYGEYPPTSRPAVFLYDGHPGGVGITEADFDQFDTLARMALQMVEGCSCKSGCPACVHSPKCGNRNRPLDKEGAIEVLKRLLARRA